MIVCAVGATSPGYAVPTEFGILSLLVSAKKPRRRRYGSRGGGEVFLEDGLEEAGGVCAISDASNRMFPSSASSGNQIGFHKIFSLTLDLNVGMKTLLAKQACDTQFGTCPLKRAIQEHLLYLLATKLLADDFGAGEKIKVRANGDSLTFKAR